MLHPDEVQYYGRQLSSICEELPSPLVITGMFRDYLANHFAFPDNIKIKDLKDLVWRDQPSSGIQIESITRWKPETTQGRPSIIIKRNAYRNVRLSTGDMYQGIPDNTEGDQYHVTAWNGSHTLFCLAKEGAHAELLATETAGEISCFAPILIKYTPFHRIQVAEIGEILEIEESDETFAVPITVAYQFEQKWEVRQVAPRLMAISMQTILNF